MNEEENFNSRLPDFEMMMAQRLNSTPNPTRPPAGTVDPYKLMLKRKEQETAPTPTNPTEVTKWPEKDIKALEDYCKRMGIVGFSCGRMSPIAALALLKQKLGDDYTGVPLEERNPYSSTTKKKDLILG